MVSRFCHLRLSVIFCLYICPTIFISSLFNYFVGMVIKSLCNMPLLLYHHFFLSMAESPTINDS